VFLKGQGHLGGCDGESDGVGVHRRRRREGGDSGKGKTESKTNTAGEDWPGFWRNEGLGFWGGLGGFFFWWVVFWDGPEMG